MGAHRTPEISIDFPGWFDKPIVPENSEAIVPFVEVVEISVYVQGGHPVNMGSALKIVKDKNSRFYEKDLTALEVRAVSSAFLQVLPLQNQSYFALTERIQGTEATTLRRTIGKFALYDDVVACVVPSRPNERKKPIRRSAVVERRETDEESVAAGVFAVINGLKPVKDGSYQDLQLRETIRRVRETARVRKRLAEARELRRDK